MQNNGEDSNQYIEYPIKTIILLMNSTKSKLYRNNPLNISKTINLPSNLLQNRRPVQPSRNSEHETSAISPRQFQELKHVRRQNQQKRPLFIEQKADHNKKNVLYKRLEDIKVQNQQLGNFSFSKLLSKMVVVEPKESNTPFALRSIDLQPQISRKKSPSQFACLRSKVYQIDCQQDNQGYQSKSIDCKRYSNKADSSIDAMRTTTKLFRRFYMPSTDKANPNFFKTIEHDQKFIYINGKKTECKRIHNFYTSSNFRTSYDKAFKRTNDSLPSKNHRQSFKY